MPIAADIYYHSPNLGSSDHLPVVLIHGAGGTQLNWPPGIRRLPDFRVFSIDLPGHGKSGQRGLQTINAYVDCILSWMEAIGLHRAVFVGHSMGGAIALMLAKKHADQVLGLGLISTGARLRVHPEILEHTANAQTFPSAIAMIKSIAFSLHADSRLIELAGKRMAEIRPSVLHGDFIACNGFDLMGSLSTIRTPSLVICGEKDSFTPIRYAQYLSHHLPNAQLKVISDAGHMVMLEKPQTVSNILMQFLTSIPYSPGGF